MRRKQAITGACERVIMRLPVPSLIARNLGRRGPGESPVHHRVPSVDPVRGQAFEPDTHAHVVFGGILDAFRQIGYRVLLYQRSWTTDS